MQVKHWSLPKTLVFDVILPLSVISGLPHWTKVSWRGMYESAPDLFVVLWLTTMMGIATGIIKVLRSRTQEAIAAGSSSSQRGEGET